MVRVQLLEQRRRLLELKQGDLFAKTQAAQGALRDELRHAAPMRAQRFDAAYR